MADGGLALLAAVFPEPQDPLGPPVLEVPSPQKGDSADAGPGVGQGSQKSPVAEAHYVGGVDQAEEIPGLGDGEAGSLAVGGIVLPAADRLERIQGGGVPGH